MRDWLDGIEPEQKPEPPEKACQENLCQIQVAKALWAQDYGKSENDLPLAEDLYGRYTGESPICPTGGRYTIGVLRVVPHCSIHGPLKETYPEKPETR